MLLGARVFTLGVICFWSLALSGRICCCVKISDEVSTVSETVTLLRSYKNKLDKHLSLWESLFSGDSCDVSTWFISSSDALREKLLSKINRILGDKRNQIPPQAISDLDFVRKFLLENRSNKFAADVESGVQRILDRFEAEVKIFGLSSIFDHSTWLFREGKALASAHDSVTNSTKRIMATFPVNEIGSKISSRVLRQGIYELCNSGKFDHILSHWKSICYFLDNPENVAAFDAQFGVQSSKNRLYEAELFVKELSNFIHILYVFFMTYPEQRGNSLFAQYLPEQCDTFMDILHIYNVISDLPLDNTLWAIDDFIRRFVLAISRLEGGNDDENQDNNGVATDSFIGWLKNKWVLVPLAVGVIIVKTVYHFWVQEYKQDSPSFFMGDFLRNKLS